jgi:hypothetical protein
VRSQQPATTALRNSLITLSGRHRSVGLRCRLCRAGRESSMGFEVTRANEELERALALAQGLCAGVTFARSLAPCVGRMRSGPDGCVCAGIVGKLDLGGTRGRTKRRTCASSWILLASAVRILECTRAKWRNRTISRHASSGSKREKHVSRRSSSAERRAPGAVAAGRNMNLSRMRGPGRTALPSPARNEALSRAPTKRYCE